MRARSSVWRPRWPAAPSRGSRRPAGGGCTACTLMSDRRSCTRRNWPPPSPRWRRSATTPSTTSAAGLAAGTPTPTTPRAPPPSLAESLDPLIGAAREHLPAGARILIEPGRSVVAPSAVTVYRVTTVKPGATTFVAVDGGMVDNLEVALVGQRFEARIADRVGGGEPVTVVGRHCESGEIGRASCRE